MTDDQIFRLVLVAAMAVYLPVSLFYRIRSRAGGEQLDRRQEGPFILIAIRVLGAAATLGVVAFVIDPAWMAWASLSLPTPLRWLGAASRLTGVALGIWTLRSLGSNLTNTVVTRREHTLVTHGPYRHVQHPLYVAAALAYAGNALATANWFIALAGVATLVVVVLRTPIEEAKLGERFGDDYRRYVACTGRFIPRGLRRDRL